VESSNLLQNTKDCATLKQNTAASPQPQPFLQHYFQERRRALLTELKAIEEALKELRVERN
jgi:hypothetical protein